MAIDSNVLQEVVDALKQDPEIKNNVYQATVSRIDGEGVVWVNIAGSDTETPTAITSAEVAPGDAVNVEWRNNKLYIGGNYSNPSAGVVRVANVEQIADVAVANASRAQTAAANAEISAQSAQESASAASTAAGNALTAAGTAQTAADSALVGLSTVEDVVGVLNWITAHGTMTSQSGGTFDPDQVYFVMDDSTPGDYHVGSHYYSIVSEPKAADINSYYVLTVDESVQNYVATHIVVDSEGLWIIPDAGGNKVLIATGNGSTYTTAGTYIVGKVGGVDTVFAKFLSSGATMQAENGTTIAHLGYGPGKNSVGGTSNAPYYTLGIRTGTVGNYSVVEGDGNISSNYASHAEGTGTTASGAMSHAEGSACTASGSMSHAENNGTTASGGVSHAEGFSTTASGAASHSEGEGTTASGTNSHAQNTGTTAQRKSQTALGEYNIADTSGADGTVRGDYAVIVGNGTADNARSNALTVDWSGNVEAAGDITDGAGNTLSSVASALSSLIVVETKTLGTNVSVSANGTSPSYNIPGKTGYTVAAVTPIVTGGYNGHYFAAITSSDNDVPTSLYFKNTHTSAHTNSFYIRVVYVKS